MNTVLPNLLIKNLTNMQSGVTGKDRDKVTEGETFRRLLEQEADPLIQQQSVIAANHINWAVQVTGPPEQPVQQQGVQEIVPLFQKSPVIDKIQTAEQSNQNMVLQDVESLQSQEIPWRVENVELQEMLPKVENIQPQEATPEMKTVPPQEVIAKVETAELQEVMPKVGTVELQGVMPEVETVQPQEVIAKVKTVELQEVIAKVKTVELQEVMPYVETVELQAAMPKAETLQQQEVIAKMENVQSQEVMSKMETVQPQEVISKTGIVQPQEVISKTGTVQPQEVMSKTGTIQSQETMPKVETAEAMPKQENAQLEETLSKTEHSPMLSIKKQSEISEEKTDSYTPDLVSTTNRNQTVSATTEQTQLPKLQWSESVDRIQELTNYIEKTIASQDQEIAIELEPAHLGRIVLKASMHAGEAVVEITCFTEHAKESIANCVNDIGGLLQNRMGGDTAIYVEMKQDNQWNPDENPEHGNPQQQREQEQQSKKEKRYDYESDFLQQLRLGIT